MTTTLTPTHYSQLYQTALQTFWGKQVLLCRLLETYHIPWASSTSPVNQPDLASLTPEQAERLISKRIDLLKRRVIGPEKIRRFFLREKQQQDQVTFGVLRLLDETLAEDLYTRLTVDRIDFNHLAQQYSIGPEASVGGTVGPRPLNGLHPTVKATLLKLAPGETSPPVWLNNSAGKPEMLVLLRMIQHAPAKLTPAEEERILNRLFESWLDRQWHLYCNQYYPASKR